MSEIHTNQHQFGAHASTWPIYDKLGEAPHSIYEDPSEIPYKHQSPLGDGSFGWVDLVVRQDRRGQDQYYARKTIRIRSGRTGVQLGSIHNEVSIVKRMCHNHITRLVSTYLCKKTFGIIMLPVADGNLKEWMEQADKPGRDQEERLKFLPKWSECLAHALEYIHNQRVRHKDIKPANVLVMGDEVFITDFGIAKDFIDEANSASTDTNGLHTKVYSAPEVMIEHARRGRKADMFSLGCVILEMVTVFLRESLQDFCSLRESKGPNASAYYASLDKVLQWTEHLLDVFDRRNDESSVTRKWVLLPALLLRREASDRPMALELVQQLSKLAYGDIPRCRSCTTSIIATTIHGTKYDALEDGHTATAKDILVGYDGSSGVVVDDSKHYFLVPYSRNANFIGRESQLSELRVMTDLHFQHSRMAVTGLGGMGKTQTVLELAYRKEKQCSVFWVHASSLSRLEQSYLGIGQALGIPAIEKSNEDVKPRVKEWLESPQMGKWLMIFDNVDDLDLLVGSTRSGQKCDLFDYLPSRSNGHIVFTTRDLKTGMRLAKSDPLLIEKFSLEHSSLLLQNTILRRHLLDSESKAAELINLLEYHPLAIVQAASYISENQIPVSEYVELFNESVESRVDLKGGDSQATSRYNDITPVLSTWLISFEVIRHKESLAAGYFSFVCCVDRSAIPKSILPRDKGVTAGKVVSALGTLRAYSFINMRKDGQSFDVHRLVEQAGRYWLRNSKELSNWTNKAAIRMEEVLPDGQHWEKPKFNLLLPHALCVLKSKHLHLTDTLVEHKLLYRAAWCLTTNGDYVQCEAMARKDVELIESSLKESGPLPGLGLEELLSATNWIVETVYFQGKYENAVHMAREALSRTEALGPNNVQTLRCLNNLAISLRGLESYEASEATDRLVLERRSSILGLDHPHTLKTMANLSHCLRLQGKLSEAAMLHTQVLEMRTKVLSYDHSDRFVSVNNLALVWQDQGEANRAEEAHRAVLTLQQSAPYQYHDTGVVLTWQCLVAALNKQRKFNEAEETGRAALKAFDKLLFANGRHYQMMRGSYADTLASCGRLEEAYTIISEAAETFCNSHGPRHPDALTLYCIKSRIHHLRGKTHLAKRLLISVIMTRLKTQNAQNPQIQEHVIALAMYHSKRLEYSLAHIIKTAKV